MVTAKKTTVKKEAPKKTASAPKKEASKKPVSPSSCSVNGCSDNSCGCECIPSVAVDTVRECADCISNNVEKRLLPKCCFTKAASNVADFTFETFAKLIGDKKI